MATKTTNYNLTKPSYNESADISVINQNMDIIDEKMKEIENASGGGGTSVTVDRELSTTSENPVQNKVITQALNDKGTYSKPTGGIPKTDLANEVQTSLGKADTALQEHQDISGKADKTEVTAILNSISDAWNSATAYTVGQYCIYNNALWKCLVANTNTEPAEGTYWTRTTIDAEISAVNSNLNDIGKSCCFQQSNTTNITNTFCPVDIQNYNDDTDLYKADGGGVLITKPGTYVVQASFHVLFAGGDDITLKLVNSISELINTEFGYINEGNSKQFTISLSKIVRIKSGQERVLLQLLSSNGNSYIFANTMTNANRIAITKIA